MNTADFLKSRTVKAQEAAITLNAKQIQAILCDERAVEMLDFRDRDDLIVKGIARRCAPSEQNPHWRTWLTMTGLMVRAMF